MEKFRWKELFAYYKPQRGLFAADMLFAVLNAAVALAIPLIVRFIATDVVYWESERAIRGILIILALLLALLAVEMYCNYFIASRGHIMGARIERRMRSELFAHYQELSFAFFDGEKVGKLMSRVTNDLFDISEMLHHGPEEIVICSMKLIGTFIILLVINWKLALIAFIPVPLMLWFAIVYNKKMKSAFVDNRACIGEINAAMEDSLSGIKTVKSFANEAYEIEKFKDRNDRFVDSKKRSYKYMADYQTVLNAMTTVITIAIAVAGTLLMVFGQVELSDLLVFLLYISNFTEPVRKLVFLTESLQNGFAGYKRFREMMAVAPEISDAPDAVELSDVKGEVTFDNVSFSYSEGGDVLENLSLEVRPGDFVALVGLSGVGKTTLCNLIPRFYDVTGGSVRVDGKDVRSLTQRSLRDCIGIVQQDVYLFAGTVMENIRYGKPDATDEEVFAAARMANAHDFISQLPNGYDSDVGQRGVRLSGGQKQRLAIARVFLKNPPILIFDEATSALDNESERVVQQSMELLAKGRTSIVIAHRLSTIRNARRILVLTDEGIAEEGTHEELLSKGGVYAGLYSSANF